MDFSFITSITDPRSIIETLGTIGVITIVFLETGVFFGFFFPGDSLLFTAGFLASQGYVSISVLLVGTFLAAIIGDSFGYGFGKKIGPKIFTREDSIFFNKNHIKKAQDFYEKHGKKTIILARFMPIIRTFAPIVAGIGNMHYRIFLVYNIVGAFLWTWSMLLLGYGLGALIPDPDKYVLPVVIVIIVVSAFPGIKEVWKQLYRKQQ
jgi:membrane-associated protein